MRNFFSWLERWVFDDDSTFLGVTKLILVLTLLVALVFGPFVWFISYEDSKDPHIVLNKTEWHCAHTQTYYVPMLVGKVIMMMPQTQCDAYSRN